MLTTIVKSRTKKDSTFTITFECVRELKSANINTHNDVATIMSECTNVYVNAFNVVFSD